MTIKRKNCSPLSVALAGASSPLGEPSQHIPQAVIRPLTWKDWVQEAKTLAWGYKTASGNQAFHVVMALTPADRSSNRYKTASGNLAFNFQTCEQL